MDPQHLKEDNCLRLKGFDHIDLYVGNSVQASHFYRMAFGFTPTFYAGLETGLRDRQSLVLQQSGISLILTSPLDPESRIAEHVREHGDGIKDIAFEVDNTEEVFGEAVRRGAQPLLEPTVLEDQNGVVVKATIAACADVIHSFIQRRDYGGRFLPDFRPVEGGVPARESGLLSIDHIAFGVERDTLDEWVDFYGRVFGFHQSHHEEILTEYSGMNSKVVENSTGEIKFPLVEPATGRRRSQVEEYLEFHRGPGAQHVALLTDDILATIRALRANGIEFIKTPNSYYDMLEDRVGKIDIDIDALRELNILVDRDRWGYLMQIFTKPVQSRPTFFIEIIQRQGARGFGAGNIAALFEAVEREQAVRGNL
jgi:4-hydroxyphenylpyruvate dioxygenase